MTITDPAYYRAYREKHKDELSRRSAAYSWNVHKQAIISLGGICVNCGETDLRVLQINHLKGVNHGKGRIKWHRQIINGETTDLDVRCANCNILYEYERGHRKEWPLIRRQTTYGKKLYAPVPLAYHDKT